MSADLYFEKIRYILTAFWVGKEGVLYEPDSVYFDCFICGASCILESDGEKIKDVACFLCHDYSDIFLAVAAHAILDTCSGVFAATSILGISLLFIEL